MKTKIFETILDVVSEVCEVSKEDLLSQGKQDEVVEARAMLIWYCRWNGLHANDIAKFVKRKHPNSVNDYLNKYRIYKSSTLLFRMLTERISKILPQRLSQLTEKE